MSAALAFSHGANDAQKSVGVIAALLLADGRIDTLAAPTWATLACAAALTAGTALGGWRIIRTVGRRIYRIQPIDGLASQTASAGGDLRGLARSARRCRRPRSSPRRWSASAAGRRRWHHVHWAIVRQMGLAWLITMPATAALGALALGCGGWWHDDAGAGSCPRRPTCSACCAARSRSRSRAWTRSRPGRAATRPRPRRVRDAEHRGDAAKRELLERAAGGVRHPARARGPVRALARHRLDPRLRARPGQRVRGDGLPARRGIAEMAGLLGDALRHIDEALIDARVRWRRRDRGRRRGDRGRAPARARLLRRDGGAARSRGPHERIARRELYRRCSGSARVVDVAERVVYAVVKQS